MPSKSDSGERMIKEFNIVISGIGGQGVLTLSQVIAEAAFLQDYDVKTSELHGLAQRGGHIESHVRFGKKIYSSLVMEGEANLIFGLEPLETLRVCHYASKEVGTVFLFDSHEVFPLSVYVLSGRYPTKEEILTTLKKFSSRVICLNATEETIKNFGTSLPSNIYLLSYAVLEKLIPLKSKFILEAMRKVLPKKFYELNEKVFELVQKSKKRKINLS